MRLLSLCTGIGGIDYVWSRVLGQEIIGQVEIDPYCTAVLERHWPDVPRCRDLRELEHDDPFTEADLVAGGIPCQPFSLAGKRRGTQDDRYLWPSAFALIKRRRPTWCLIENVAGFVSLALDLIQADLESAGYTTQAYVLPACAVGAPHIRERVFVVAHTTGRGSQVSQIPAWTPDQSHSSSLLAHASCAGCQEARTGERAVASFQCSQDVAHSDGDRQRQWEKQSQCQFQCQRTPNAGTHGPKGNVAHSNQQRSQIGGGCPAQGWAPTPIDGRTPGAAQSRMGRSSDGLSDWLDCMRWPALPGRPQAEWEPPRTISEKLPYRAARLRALGNALMPQQVYPFLQFIVTYEQRGYR